MNFIFKQNIWVFWICAAISLSMVEPNLVEKDSSLFSNTKFVRLDEDTVESNFTFTDKINEPKKCFTVESLEGASYRWWFDIYKDSMNARSLSNPNWQSMDKNPCFTYDSVGCYFVALELTQYDGYISDTIVKQVCNSLKFVTQKYNIFVPGIDSNGNKRIFDLGIEDCQYFEMNIYNRWGSKVFHSETEAHDWDGNLLDTETVATDGTYFYNLKYMQYSYTDTTEKFGTIMLINPTK